jgi:prepilin-type N-terminal cleavage/methylation domain-containing protein
VKRGLTLVEILLGAVILSVIMGFATAGFNLLTRQSRHAFASLSQMQDAELLLETIRLEASSIVLNPFADARLHHGNSFIISEPHGSSIQFVMERQTPAGPERSLVYYEAKPRPGAASGMMLRKMVWKFKRLAPWLDPIQFPPGWPADWIGEPVEFQQDKFRSLNFEDIQWLYYVPSENEGRVFLRVKMTLHPHDGGALIPLSTLIALTTPDPPATVSDCPCLFHPGFDPVKRDCNFCIGGTR